MLALHAASSAELLDVARRLVESDKLDAPVKLLQEEYGGRIVRVATVFAHVVNHGTHHRAQALNMLRQLGRPRLGDLDPVEWELAGEPEARVDDRDGELLASRGEAPAPAEVVSDVA
jgi:uncharacterized damage-inducible protein DinB